MRISCGDEGWPGPRCAPPTCAQACQTRTHGFSTNLPQNEEMSAQRYGEGCDASVRWGVDNDDAPDALQLPGSCDSPPDHLQPIQRPLSCAPSTRRPVLGWGR